MGKIFSREQFRPDAGYLIRHRLWQFHVVALEFDMDREKSVTIKKKG